MRLTATLIKTLTPGFWTNTTPRIWRILLRMRTNEESIENTYQKQISFIRQMHAASLIQNPRIIQHQNPKSATTNELFKRVLQVSFQHLSYF